MRVGVVGAMDWEGMERGSVGREVEEGEGKGHGGGGAGREEPRVGRQCSASVLIVGVKIEKEDDGRGIGENRIIFFFCFPFLFSKKYMFLREILRFHLRSCLVLIELLKNTRHKKKIPRHIKFTYIHRVLNIDEIKN